MESAFDKFEISVFIEFYYAVVHYSFYNLVQHDIGVLKTTSHVSVVVCYKMQLSLVDISNLLV